MSDTLFNIRFGTRHFQWYKRRWLPKIMVNAYWVAHKPTKWLEVYCWFGKHYYEGRKLSS